MCVVYVSVRTVTGASCVQPPSAQPPRCPAGAAASSPGCAAHRPLAASPEGEAATQVNNARQILRPFLSSYLSVVQSRGHLLCQNYIRLDAQLSYENNYYYWCRFCLQRPYGHDRRTFVIYGHFSMTKTPL